MKERFLVIDRQNVGRSQIGEGYLRNLTMGNPNVGVASAGIEDIGTMKRKYHNRPNQQVVDVMLEEGIDISKQHVKKLRRSMLRKATRVIVLLNKDEEDKLPKFALKHRSKMIFIPIEDPAKGTQQNMPNLDTERLRYIRDQIKMGMLHVKELSR